MRHTRIAVLNTAGRDLVVGDVHGCFRTLDRALVELDFDQSRDRLFGVGDLVNRGPNSADALVWLEERFHAATLGNHERPVRDWFRKVDRADYERWHRALAQMPLALTIETRYGAVGVIHAQAPDPEWRRALDMLATGLPGVVDIAVLGFATKEEEARARPVEGIRALVHGHWPVEDVETNLNRWNIDTGAGLPNGRLSVIEVNGPDLRFWTFEADDS